MSECRELPVERSVALQLERLMLALKLGEMVSFPSAVTGGLMHKMYAVETTLGKFAIKALNPQIMLRPEALGNLMKAERIAQLAAKHVPALAAKIIADKFVHLIDDRYYLVFDWLEGVRLQPSEISRIQCASMGERLAKIHQADFTDLAISAHEASVPKATDWQYYVKLGYDQGLAWASLLQESADDLYDWEASAIQAAGLLAADRFVISHADLDPKNVMWQDGEPVIIDWEAAGYVHPLYELTETAIYWSEDSAGNADRERFSSFVDGYRKHAGTIEADWRTVLLNGYSGKLGWLVYNLRRSLWLECDDEEEQRLGTEQAILTLRALRRYAAAIPELERWLHQSMA